VRPKGSTSQLALSRQHSAKKNPKSKSKSKAIGRWQLALSQE
jgi:hypothetical protein